jgi:hypothetical protein
MDRNYVAKYYPTIETMEQRNFRVGANLTRVPLPTFFVMLAVGFGLGLLGLLISFVDYEFFEFGMFIFAVGDLFFAIGLGGIGLYFAGLRYLERAELLYNTRIAGEALLVDPSRAPAAPAAPVRTTGPGYSAPPAPPVTAARTTVSASAAAPGNWTCSCGRTHPPYVSSCVCGVSKKDIHK